MDLCTAETCDPEETAKNVTQPKPLAAHAGLCLPNIPTPHAWCQVTSGYSQAALSQSLAVPL